MYSKFVLLQYRKDRILKDRTCAYKECRFYHLSGTKNATYPKPSTTRTQSKPNQPQIPQLNNKITEKFVSKNRFAALEDEVEEEIAEVKQVFHKGQIIV